MKFFQSHRHRSRAERTYWKALVFVFALWMLWGHSLWAQSSNASITGTITETSGAAVPHASIVATDLETGLTYRSIGAGDGSFTVPTLPPGRYKVEISAPSFAKFVQ